MQSRMDKYSDSNIAYKSRTQRNKDLYENVKNSSLTDFDVNSNVSVIEEDAKSIDITKLGKILDEKYNDYSPKRRSIDVPNAYEEEPIIDQPLVDTKEYDINAILEKAKQGKNVDYNKERLKKVREAQYEILNNLDLELKKVEDAKRINERKAEEDTLMNLISTITQIESKNKEEFKKKEAEAIDLFNEMHDDDKSPDRENNSDILESKEEPAKVDKEPVKVDKSDAVSDVTKTQKEIRLVVIDPEKEQEKKKESNDEKRDEHVEKTLSKLDIDLSSYDDFSDISKNDAGTIIIKVVIFVIIIALVIGAVYILNILLDLGLF